MRKIINGKSYDTDKARKVAEWDNGLGIRDLHYYCETLYCKRTGEYFIYGEGGPASKYSVSIGLNSWSGGEKIVPITFEEAKTWAEKLDAEEYEKEFGYLSDDEGGDRITTSVSLRAAIYAKLKQRTLRERESLGDYIGLLMDQVDFLELYDRYGERIKALYNNLGMEFSLSSASLDYARSYLAEHTARSGRTVFAYLDEMCNGAIYADDGSFLSEEAMEHEIY